MSYLSRLIDRATKDSKLENNKIGNFRISPQHGNVFVYHIYKYMENKNPYNKHEIWSSGEQHIATITIVPNCDFTIDAYDKCSIKDYKEIEATMVELYEGFEFTSNVPNEKYLN